LRHPEAEGRALSEAPLFDKSAVGNRRSLKASATLGALIVTAKIADALFGVAH
jgi:hypothetical protein